MRLYRANKSMVNQHGDKLAVGSKTPLPAGLFAILTLGNVEQNACVFLTAMLEKCKSVRHGDFPDKTGYECFVNHIHIDDFTDTDMLQIAIAFLTRVSEMLKIEYSNYDFRGLISLDESSATIRIHRTRAGEEWLSNDLEGYDECVCEYIL